MTGRLLSLKNFFMIAILSAVLYFGWPIIQTMIVLSPIPDPSDITKRASNMLSQIKSKMSAGDSQNPKISKDYVSNFDQAPGVLGGDSDDDDEEYVGRDFSKKKNLNYDSDERDEIQNSEQTELVNLDMKPRDEPVRKNVPKLKKPGT